MGKVKELEKVIKTKDAENHALKILYKNSLAITAKYLLGYKDITKFTHKDTVDALQGPSKRKLIIMPRGTFKSSITSVAYPIWLLLNNPNLRIMLDGELYSNSKNFLREIKGHLLRPELTSIFGTFKDESCWNEGEILIRQRTKVLKEASITASGIGSEKTGQHYDVIICDDLNSPSNSNTEEGRQKVIDHFRYNISILEPEGILVVVATRYSELDLPGFILHSVIDGNEI